MKPDRSNYESWLIDWLDGTLDKVRAEQFMTFLEENPDIREEALSLSTIRLSPQKELFPDKHNLKKTAGDLTSSQIEYLSVAYLEKDLSAEQSDELHYCIEHNRESLLLFNSIQKTKLSPSSDVYPYKNLLKKLPSGQRLFRLTIPGLSAAATIAILVLSYIFVPDLFSTNEDQAVSEIVGDSIPVTLNIVRSNPIIARTETSISLNQKENNTPVNNTFNDSGIFVASNEVPGFSDSLPIIGADRSQTITYAMIPVPAILVTEMSRNNLIAPNISFAAIDIYDDRSRLKKFIASTFRQRLLGDETSSDDPLKPYDIAKAGVDGLNRLLDWDMELVETHGKAGEVKSVYFSSTLLTFNAPVKKIED